MKTILKQITLILGLIIFSSCSLLSDYIVYAEGNCPSVETKTNYNSGGEPDSFAPSSKLNKGNAKTTTAVSANNNGPKSEFFLSYRVGGGVKLPINDAFNFVPAIIVSGKGNKTTEAGFETKLTSTYIDVPMVATYNLGESNFNVRAGVQPSILLSAKENLKGNGNETTMDVKDRFKTLDVALVVGFGYQFKNGFGVNFGYDHGLTNIANTNSDFVSSSIKSYNRAMHLGVSYTFKAK